MDGRAMMCSVLTLSIGNNQGMGDVEYGKIYDIYFPPAYLHLFDGPSCNILDMWRVLGRSLTTGGLVVGTIIKPNLGLQPKPFGEACYAFWQGEPSGQPGFLPDERMHSRGGEGYACLRQEDRCIRTFPANITADDPVVSLVASMSCRSSAP
jgi:ribulose-bisphosphate carboxylase large chain